MNATEFLNESDEFGTISIGKKANLILVRGNPLDDLANIKKRVGVLMVGKWFDESQLLDLLEPIAEAYQY